MNILLIIVNSETWLHWFGSSEASRDEQEFSFFNFLLNIVTDSGYFTSSDNLFKTIASELQNADNAALISTRETFNKEELFDRRTCESTGTFSTVTLTFSIKSH